MQTGSRLVPLSSPAPLLESIDPATARSLHQARPLYRRSPNRQPPGPSIKPGPSIGEHRSGNRLVPPSSPAPLSEITEPAAAWSLHQARPLYWRASIRQSPGPSIKPGPSIGDHRTGSRLVPPSSPAPLLESIDPATAWSLHTAWPIQRRVLIWRTARVPPYRPAPPPGRASISPGRATIIPRATPTANEPPQTNRKYTLCKCCARQIVNVVECSCEGK
nr:uncharacterized protein LOC115263747 [Aedes albopictus]